MTVHSVVIQKLLSTNAHLGRRVAAHHFKIYTYGARNAMTIIDSDKTLICLRNACQFIGNLVRQKGKFLFVNTNSLCDEIVDQMTKRIGCPSGSSWRLGGFLTNSGSPKKFRSRNKKLHLGSVQPPDCIVIMDTERKSSVIFEADKLQIPIVGLVDSSMPWDVYKRITYPIPANDSVQFVYLFCNLITKTFLLEQKRFAAAMGAVVREDEVTTQQLSPTKTGIGEESENSRQSTTSNANFENIVIPYESLVVASDDPVETKKLLDKLVVLKLNSALGTKLGFNGPRSSIEVCNGMTYVDLIVDQIESLNFKHGCNVPLILMNTIRTHDGTLKVVEKYSTKNVDISTLCQSQSHPVTKGLDTESELYHFDPHELFLSLKKSGTLDALLLQGKEYILVVKYENVGAVIDSKILNHLIQNRIQYCKEVVQKASSDFGGTIFSSHEGKSQLELVDTGNLWVDLKAVKKLVETDAHNVEKYPASKSIDCAIGVKVPESRFQPMTSTSDLLLAQSDLYIYAEGILTRNSARKNPDNPSIELGTEFGKLSDFQSRFKSIPSIMELDSLKVVGDVWFGTGITLKGKVTITAKPGIRLEIPDGVVLENKEITDPRDL